MVASESDHSCVVVNSPDRVSASSSPLLSDFFPTRLSTLKDGLEGRQEVEKGVEEQIKKEIADVNAHKEIDVQSRIQQIISETKETTDRKCKPRGRTTSQKRAR